MLGDVNKLFVFKSLLKVKVIGSKPGYLLKSFLLYIPDYDAAVADGDDV